MSTITRAEVDARRLFPNVIQPPNHYFDVENQKGTSPFRPGLDPDVYRAFVAHFDERAQTCDAQARLDHRKGRADRADQYASLARQWREASRVALLRMRRELHKPEGVTPVLTDLLGRPLKPTQDKLALDGRIHQDGRLQPPAPVCPECGADLVRQLNAFGPDDWVCLEHPRRRA